MKGRNFPSQNQACMIYKDLRESYSLRQERTQYFMHGDRCFGPLPWTQENMAYAIGLPFGLVLAYLLAYLGAPLADAINIRTDFYGSVAEWLSRKAGEQEIGVRSQMSVVSRMLTFSNLMLVL